MKAIALLMLIAVCSTVAFTQPSKASQACSADDRRALEQIAPRWMDGYNRGDAAAVGALYAPDAYYLTQHFATGIVHGREMIQAYVQKGVDARYHVDKIDVMLTECSGDFAYTIDRYESTNGGEKAFGLNVVVLKKIDGKWKIVAHESAVPDTSTAIQSLEKPTVR
jgi:uncharacterized protein (TIGR02246 family)